MCFSLSSRLRKGWGGAIAGALTIIVCAPAARGGDIDLDQLRRILNGETIVERGGEPEFTSEFPLGECRFVPKGDTRFWSLTPGFQLYLAGDDDGEFVELFITVLPEKRVIPLEIDGRVERIKTRVIEEREYADGELIEISLNFFARCRDTNDVYYFGEEVCFFEDGECVGTGGSWIAGEDGASPGIIMPGTFLLGARYFQEVAPGIALDRAEHVREGETVAVPAGVFEGCATVLETSPLEPGAEDEKVYAPWIGLIKDGPIELISFGFDDFNMNEDDGGEDGDE